MCACSALRPRYAATSACVLMVVDGSQRSGSRDMLDGSSSQICFRWVICRPRHEQRAAWVEVRSVKRLPEAPTNRKVPWRDGDEVETACAGRCDEPQLSHSLVWGAPDLMRDIVVRDCKCLAFLSLPRPLIKIRERICPIGQITYEIENPESRTAASAEQISHESKNCNLSSEPPREIIFV